LGRSCLIITYAYQKKHNTVQARRAFLCSGQHQEPDAITGSTINFEKMMAQCYTDIPADQLSLMKEKAEFFVENYIKVQGRVPHDVLVQHGIKAGITTINRDDLAPVRHNNNLNKTCQTY
jgi:hypothetical protein